MIFKFSWDYDTHTINATLTITPPTKATDCEICFTTLVNARPLENSTIKNPQLFCQVFINHTNILSQECHTNLLDSFFTQNDQTTQNYFVLPHQKNYILKGSADLIGAVEQIEIGVLMAPPLQSYLFQPKSQLRNKNSRRYHGTPAQSKYVPICSNTGDFTTDLHPDGISRIDSQNAKVQTQVLSLPKSTASNSLFSYFFTASKQKTLPSYAIKPEPTVEDDSWILVPTDSLPKPF